MGEKISRGGVSRRIQVPYSVNYPQTVIVDEDAAPSSGV